jgi:hypothetical protein
LTPVRPLDKEEEHARQTREVVFEHIGFVQLPDLLLEVDAANRFRDALLARRPTSSNALLAVYSGVSCAPRPSEWSVRRLCKRVEPWLGLQKAGAHEKVHIPSLKSFHWPPKTMV